MLIREPRSLSTKYKSELKKKFEIDISLIPRQRFSKRLKFFPSEKGFDRKIETILILIQVDSRMIDISNDLIDISMDIHCSCILFFLQHMNVVLLYKRVCSKTGAFL